jgi:hypothetical protein
LTLQQDRPRDAFNVKPSRMDLGDDAPASGDEECDSRSSLAEQRSALEELKETSSADLQVLVDQMNACLRKLGYSNLHQNRERDLALTTMSREGVLSGHIYSTSSTKKEGERSQGGSRMVNQIDWKPCVRSARATQCCNCQHLDSSFCQGASCVFV